MGQDMAMVTIKSGEEISSSLVATIMMRLRLLLESDPSGFYEFVGLCRDRNYVLWGSYAKKLRDQGLIQHDGQPHEVVRSVVLVAATGDGPNLSLGSPV